MTARGLIQYGTAELTACEIPDAAVDAWLLFQHVTGMSRASFLIRGMELMDAEVEAAYKALIQKRCTHYPLQYITHSQNFMGLDFYVDERVLIPRQDTEILVEQALQWLKPGDQVLDMCTGSGCIVIALSVLGKVAGLGVDLSDDALCVARKNAQMNQAEQTTFLKSDLFSALNPVTYGAYFDMIVSNPPYIATEEVLKLMPEVREHEPMMALDGDADGLKFYRAIILGAGHYLKPGGRLIFEIGYDQGAAVSSLLQTAGYKQIEVHRDLAGLDRVVSAVRVQ